MIDISFLEETTFILVVHNLQIISFSVCIFIFKNFKFLKPFSLRSLTTLLCWRGQHTSSEERNSGFWHKEDKELRNRGQARNHLDDFPAFSDFLSTHARSVRICSWIWGVCSASWIPLHPWEDLNMWRAEQMTQCVQVLLRSGAQWRGRRRSELIPMRLTSFWIQILTAKFVKCPPPRPHRTA